MSSSRRPPPTATFIRVGLQSGNYDVSFSKENHQPFEITEIRVRVGDPLDLGDVLLPSISEEMQASSENAGVERGDYGGIRGRDRRCSGGGLPGRHRGLRQSPSRSTPGLPRRISTRVFAYTKLGEAAEAEGSYRKALELDATYAEPYIELSNIHAEKQEWAEAQEMLEKAVEIRPDDVRYQYNLGATAMNAADLVTAEAAFRKILELDPTFAVAHYQLGMVSVNKGANEEAIAEFEKYLELEPEGADAATATNILNHLKSQP